MWWKIPGEESLCILFWWERGRKVAICHNTFSCFFPAVWVSNCAPFAAENLPSSSKFDGTLARMLPLSQSDLQDLQTACWCEPALHQRRYVFLHFRFAKIFSLEKIEFHAKFQFCVTWTIFRTLQKYAKQHHWGTIKATFKQERWLHDLIIPWLLKDESWAHIGLSPHPHPDLR